MQSECLKLSRPPPRHGPHVDSQRSSSSAARSLTANNWQATEGNFLVSWTCSNNDAAQTYSLNAAGQIEVGGPSTGLCLSTTGSPNGQYPVRRAHHAPLSAPHGPIPARTGGKTPGRRTR